MIKPKTETFLFEPQYNTTPPAPQVYPKILHYPLDPLRHHQHRYNALFLSQLKPLLIPCDMGLPVDELIIFSDVYNSTEVQQMHPDDQILVNQDIMFQKEKERDKA